MTVGEDGEIVHESVVDGDNIDVSCVLETFILDVSRDVTGRASRREGCWDADDETLWFAGKLFGEVDFVAGRRLHQLNV